MSQQVIICSDSTSDLSSALIEKYGGALTLEELYWKLKKEHDEYFSDTY